MGFFVPSVVFVILQIVFFLKIDVEMHASRMIKLTGLYKVVFLIFHAELT